MSDWWSSLRHGGLLLAPQRVVELSSKRLDPLPEWLADRLRGDVLRLDNGGANGDASTTLITTALEQVCGFTEGRDSQWQRGNHVPAGLSRRAVTGEMIKPRRVWNGQNGALLPVFVGDEPRLGQGRARRAVSRAIEWCRGVGHPLAVLTNGRQFRLLHAGPEHDAWAEWDTALWFEGGQPGPQVEALRRLLDPEQFIPPAAGEAAPLLESILKSRQGQSQLSSTLGERVRQAVEVLIQAHGPYLRQHPEFSHPDIYRAGTLVIMRLVIILFAESRHLFPRDNRIYEQSYGLNGLWEKLQRAAGGHTARLRHRYGAWPQVLALFRLIHDGSHHSDLAMRGYGGELFRPGAADATDPVRRVMRCFESACFQGNPPVMSDADLHQILERLTRCVVPVRQALLQLDQAARLTQLRHNPVEKIICGQPGVEGLPPIVCQIDPGRLTDRVWRRLIALGPQRRQDVPQGRTGREPKWTRLSAFGGPFLLGVLHGHHLDALRVHAKESCRELSTRIGATLGFDHRR